MRHRAAFGLFSSGIGILLIILSILTLVTNYALPLHPVILLIIGVLLLALGLFLLATALFEALSQSQTALVDGLQAACAQASLMVWPGQPAVLPV